MGSGNLRVTMLNDLVELLERQWRFLFAQEGAAFYRQLRRFIKFIQEDPRLVTHLDDIQRDAQKLIQKHHQHDHDLTQQLIALKADFSQVAPDEDDSSTAPPANEWPPHGYETSLAYFNEVATNSHVRQIQIDTLADTSSSKTLLKILAAKFNNPTSLLSKPGQRITRTDAQQSQVDSLERQRLYLKQQHEYAHRNFIDEKLTSSGLLLSGVLRLLRDFNPEPMPIPARQEDRDAQLLAQLNQYMNEELATPGKRNLEDALYSEHSSSNDQNEKINQSVRALKLHMERIYEDLRLRIGTRQSLLGLINRFQHRCQWHDRKRLYNLAESTKGQAEEVLTAELALWLFDQGLSPVSKPMMAGLQPDLTDPSSKFNLYVEAKQYAGSAKEYLIHGVHQLWDTVSGLKGTPYEVNEAFYIVFRRGGPRYILPEQPLLGEGWTAHLRLIDIAPPQERGSRATQKPIVISADEITPARR